MNRQLHSLVLIIGLGFGSLAHANSPYKIIEVAQDIYRGGNTDHKMKEAGNITDFSQLCSQGITLVINVYAKFPLRHATTCPDGHEINYLGSNWSSGRPEDAAVAAIKDGGKVFIHCMWGIDASNMVAHIVAAKTGRMSPEGAAHSFKEITRKGSLGRAKYEEMANTIIARSR